MSDLKQSIQLEAALRSAGYAEAKAECASECAAAAAECEALKTRLSSSEAARMSVTEQSETLNARTAELEAELAGMRATGTLSSRKALKAEHTAQLEALQQLRRTDAFQAEERGRAAARDELADELRDAAEQLSLAKERALLDQRLADEALALQLAEMAKLRISVGMLKSSNNTLRAKTKTVDEACVALSRVEKREVEVSKEMANARASNAELRTEKSVLQARVYDLEGAQRRAGSGLAADPYAVRLIPPRVSGKDSAPLTARTLAYLRQLVELTNGSFVGAAGAVALVQNFLIDGDMRDEFAFSPTSIKHAFERLGMVDDDLERAKNAASKEPFGLSLDGGNKKRAMCSLELTPSSTPSSAGQSHALWLVQTSLPTRPPPMESALRCAPWPTWGCSPRISRASALMARSTRCKKPGTP